MNEKLDLLNNAARNGDWEQVSSLIAEGVDLNKEINGGKAIHWAAINGTNKVIELLLSTGCVHVDSANSYGATALHLAVFFRRYSTIELLVSKKANGNIQDCIKQTALHWALNQFSNCRNHNDCLESIANQCEKIHLYLKDIPIKVKCGSLAIAAFLIVEANADSTIKDNNGNTPFDLIRRDRELIVALLEELKDPCFRFNLRLKLNTDECIKRIEEKESDATSIRIKVEQLENTLKENNNIIKEMRKQLDDYKTMLEDKDNTIITLQSTLTSTVYSCDENMKSSAKQRDNEIAVIKAELAEYANISQKLNDKLNDRNKEIANLMKQIKEGNSELERHRLELQNMEEALSVNTKKTERALMERENQVTELSKELDKCTKMCEQKEKAIDEKVTAAIKQTEIEVANGMQKLKKRFEYLESFHLCSKCGETKVTLILLCGHKYCDNCYDNFGDTCAVKN